MRNRNVTILLHIPCSLLVYLPWYFILNIKRKNNFLKKEKRKKNNEIEETKLQIPKKILIILEKSS